MKNKLRVKLLREIQKAKNIRSAILMTDGVKSFEMRLYLQKQNKKVDFIKKFNLYL